MPRPSTRTSGIFPASDRRAILRRAAAGCLALMGGLSLVACEPADGDQATREDLYEAYTLRAARDPQRQYVTLADNAAGANASPATLAQANELVGDISLELATAAMAGPIIVGEEALPGLHGVETRALVLSEQAHRLANALALGSSYIRSEQQKDPARVLGSIDQRIGGIREGESWEPGESGVMLPTVADAQKEVDQLNIKLEQLQGQITQLQRQREQMLSEASQLDQQSDQQQGQESVQTYRRVADLRTEAAGVTSGIEALNVQVRQTSAELQQARAVLGALETTIGTLQQQQASLRENWQGVQTQIGQLQEAGQATFSGTDAGVSVEAIAAQLQETLGRLAELREEATSLLEKANTHYGTAAGQARAASGTAGPMFSAAYNDAFNPNRIALSNAVALRQLGVAHAGSASIYASLHGVQQTLAEAGRDLPAAIQGALETSPEDAYKEAVSAAAQALMEADQMLTDLAGSGTGPLSRSAITQRAVVLTYMTSLRGLIETTGIDVPTELLSEQEIRQQAQRVLEAARQSTAPLPQAMPFFAGADAAPATTGPSTQPATEPATQPEDEPAEEAGAEMTDDPAAAGGEPEGGAPDEAPPDGQ